MMRPSWNMAIESAIWIARSISWVMRMIPRPSLAILRKSCNALTAVSKSRPGGRFVSDDEFRIPHKSGGKQDSSCHTSGELERVKLIGTLFQVKMFEEFFLKCPNCFALNALYLFSYGHERIKERNGLRNKKPSSYRGFLLSSFL